MKKVTVFIPSLAIAGAEKVVTDLAIHIDKSKIDLTVAIINNNKQTYFYERLKKNNIKIVDLSASGNKLKAVYNIFKYLRKQKPDVIHANVATLQYLILPVLIAGVQKKYYTVHGAAQYLAETPIRKFIYRFCFKVLQFKTVAISSFVKETINKEYNIPMSDICKISNGVDLTQYAPSKKKDNQFRIISVGRFQPVKNQGLLIDAFNLVLKKHPNTELVMLGDGPLKEELLTKMQELGIRDKVVMPGNVSNTPAYLTQSSVYVGTSLFEGFSLTAVEAMACGIPVIFTKAGGVSDIVTDGVDGYLCDYRAEEIADRINYLIENPDVLQRFSTQAIESVKKFDIQKFANEYEKLYLS